MLVRWHADVVSYGPVSKDRESVLKKGWHELCKPVSESAFEDGLKQLVGNTVRLRAVELDAVDVQVHELLKFDDDGRLTFPIGKCTEFDACKASVYSREGGVRKFALKIPECLLDNTNVIVASALRCRRQGSCTERDRQSLLPCEVTIWIKKVPLDEGISCPRNEDVILINENGMLCLGKACHMAWCVWARLATWHGIFGQGLPKPSEEHKHGYPLGKA
eukprot:366062-Chlamydomonas_euryale.AAC.8